VPAEEIGETKDITQEPTEKLAAPEDVSLYLSAERASADLPKKEDDEEDESFSMSELMALASLASGQSPNATPGASAPMITPLAGDQGTAAPTATAAADLSTLSPAERALLQSTTGVSQTPAPAADGGVSAEEYARRQLAALEGDDGSVAGAPVVTG